MTEFASCSTVTHRVARKEHKCCECYGIIEPMDVYEYTSGVWDGRGMSFKVCGHCEAARDWLLEETDWPGVEDTPKTFAFGDLKAHLREVVQEYGAPKFPAYRFIVLMDRRRKAAKEAK